ncbi:MAG TPA: DMT family transporter [Patescibacteria group bacterium]|nr:DMT family transporter [Patescibacteria group bacterium]
MTSILLGLLTALCWGWADVLARFTGRALGAQGSLFGMMLAGTLGLSLWMTLDGQPWPGIPSWWTIGTAVLAAAAMLLFYEALRRGPVSLVSPAASAYPAWAVLISMALGVVPPLGALAAMTLTMIGVLLVARYAIPEPDAAHAPARRHVTFILAMIASVAFSVLLLTGQQAILIDGEMRVLWWGRASAALLMAAVLLFSPRPPALTWRSGGLAGLQGLLDTLGLAFLFAAGRGLDGTMAAVASSSFGVVTVLLARLLYKERLSLGQGFGIAAVFLGVASLAALA